MGFGVLRYLFIEVYIGLMLHFFLVLWILGFLVGADIDRVEGIAA